MGHETMGNSDNNEGTTPPAPKQQQQQMMMRTVVVRTRVGGLNDDTPPTPTLMSNCSWGGLWGLWTMSKPRQTPLPHILHGEGFFIYFNYLIVPIPEFCAGRGFLIYF